MATLVAQEVPATSSMAVPHGPSGVRTARHRLRDELAGHGVPDQVIDDAILVLSELLSNACRHGRPLPEETVRPGPEEFEEGDVLAAWEVTPGGRLTVEVTDGGGPTRPVPSTPSVSAHGGRGLGIVTALAEKWGVRDDPHGEVTVWATLSPGDHRAEDFASRVTGATAVPGLAGLGLDESGFEETGFEGPGFGDPEPEPAEDGGRDRAGNGGGRNGGSGFGRGRGFGRGGGLGGGRLGGSSYGTPRFGGAS
ncbi:ATP-binding protein [Streptomyces sp. SPB074]|uniref:ATP-binding protein n=1 Tax=Streptomyces sp. (strain SPB074) TaxID=465543 RepID=UPI0001D1DDF6|nr:ATP-binding protein [Streptomyces sp. SPB074]EFG64981.1 regulatory protein [Streptomyces sp. SPB074]